MPEQEYEMEDVDEQFHEEAATVADNMRQYGGGFATQLGELIAHADTGNMVKIANTWPELWQKFANWDE